MFYCRYKQPIDGREGEEISVAHYFEHLAAPRARLAFPQLPGECCCGACCQQCARVICVMQPYLSGQGCIYAYMCVNMIMKGSH
jgi:hypothetical protein